MKRYLYKNIKVTPLYNKTYLIQCVTKDKSFGLAIVQADNMKQAYNIGKQEIDNLNK